MDVAPAYAAARWTAQRWTWLRWAAVAFAAVESVHVTVATVGNEWEGWRHFLEGIPFFVFSGLLLAALTYGLLVRWGLKRSRRGRNRAASAGLAAGILAVASYTIYFIWAPFFLAPAAVLLGRVGLARADEQGRGRALAGILLGVGSLAFGVVMVAVFLATGDYPIDFPG